MTEEFKPFKNNEQSLTLCQTYGQGITFENNEEYIIIYGDFTIKKDSISYENLNDLINLLNNIKNEIKRT